MLDSDRIDVPVGMHVDKTGDAHECIICHYWYYYWILDFNQT